MSEFDCDIHQEDKDEIWDCLSCVYESIENRERERIIAVIQSGVWLGESIQEDIYNLIDLIKRKAE